MLADYVFSNTFFLRSLLYISARHIDFVRSA